MSSDCSNAEIRDKLYAIEQRIEAFDPFLPDSSREAYEAAVEALATGGEGASTDSEIDSLLPESMRDRNAVSKSNDSSKESDDSDISKLIDFASKE